MTEVEKRKLRNRIMSEFIPNKGREKISASIELKDVPIDQLTTVLEELENKDHYLSVVWFKTEKSDKTPGYIELNDYGRLMAKDIGFWE